MAVCPLFVATPTALTNGSCGGPDQLEAAVPTERDKLIIRLLADTGICVGKLCGLQVDDTITAQNRRSFLKVRGKGSKERLVPLTPPLIRRIDRYRRTRPGDARNEPVFLAARKNQYGEYAPLTRSGVLQLLRHAADRAGITRRVTRISSNIRWPPRHCAEG